MGQIETYISEHKEQFLEDLKAWVRIPSISTLPEHTDDMYRAAEYAVQQLKNIGFEHAQIIKTKGHPLVSAEWLNAPGKPTVLAYGHYDVQPVDPIDLWETDPFEPVVRGDHLYGRGTSDDKGQTMIIIKALETLMRVEGSLPVNVRVLLEGEEEVSGESITSYVQEHYKELGCDAVLICDTGIPSAEQPALIYGLRGIIYTEIEVFGAKRDLHSGMYGGVAPNPIHALALILSRLKDEDGHINIPGLYERVRQPTEAEKAFWQEDPLQSRQAYMDEMGVEQLSGDETYPPMQRTSAMPTLEVHGIIGGFIGEGGKTVIPAIAKAKVSMRLPADLTADETFTLLDKALHEVAPKDVQVKLVKIAGGDAVLVDTNSPAMRAAEASLEEVFGTKPYLIREGGSIPIGALLDSLLQVPIIFLGFALADDQIHAPNERYSLTQFYKGIQTMALFFKNFASAQ